PHWRVSRAAQPFSQPDELRSLKSERPVADRSDHLSEAGRPWFFRSRVAREKQVRRQHTLAAIDAVGSRCACLGFTAIVEHNGGRRCFRRRNRLQANTGCAQPVAELKTVRAALDPLAFRIVDSPGAQAFGLSVPDHLAEPLAAHTGASVSASELPGQL